MIKANIITPWSGAGTEKDAYRPMLCDVFEIASWQDITGQSSENLQPSPNLYVVEVETENSILEKIETDTRFRVLWSEQFLKIEAPNDRKG